MVGIVFNKKDNMALFSTVCIYIFQPMLANNFVSKRQFSFTMKRLSQLSFLKFASECVMTVIYGFDGCPKDKVSSAFNKLDIEDNDFWLKPSLLLLYFLVLNFYH
jgi:hypothetical protein